MVTFTQQMGGFQTPNLSEVTKICTQHPECKDCPLLTQNLNIGGATVTCVTDRQKGVKNENN